MGKPTRIICLCQAQKFIVWKGKSFLCPRGCSWEQELSHYCVLQRTNCYGRDIMMSLFPKPHGLPGGSISFGVNTYRPNFAKRENNNNWQYLQLRVMKGSFPWIEMRVWIGHKIHCIEPCGLKGFIAFMPLVYPCQLMPIIGSGRCINERMSLGPMSLAFSWKMQADLFDGVAMLG